MLQAHTSGWIRSIIRLLPAAPALGHAATEEELIIRARGRKWRAQGAITPVTPALSRGLLPL